MRECGKPSPNSFEDRLIIIDSHGLRRGNIYFASQLPAGGSEARELWKPKGFRYDVDVKFLPVAI